ncbi:Transposon TX1 uncharacterized 149 kDa protein [Vitis vinifera]|uniref:Transposon TX1 uncharacterized 149 kDa protein n=1 Tax=Vitis vinifera TaxID=29760 RepID=A0A438INX0_VITVI|nr:Transposon TX1 uncharacterized 149 kDa protein [Vitis vinifera]
MSRRISDFRPISLITSLYKIIAKVLAGRIRGVLHETIHSTQGAFVQGRQILDAVLIANEIVDEKRRSGEEGVVFKIDFEKAYDHVSWDFLDHVLEMKGFGIRWRKWMRGCLSSVSFAVLVNGNAKGWVKASRGLRQGDPLSPFLFTIVADVLSRMLLKAEERNVLEGFKNHLSRLAEMLDCKASGWPILYLGLPLGGNPKTSGFWDPVIERISRRLDGWQKAYLSFGGRITLIQSCLTHMPCVGEGKRDHLVNWDVGSGCGDILERVLLYGIRYGIEFGSRMTLVGGTTFGVQYPRLLRVVTDKNAPISSILGYTRPFSWNFTFRRNLSDSEIEDLEGLMQSLDRLHISSSVPDKRSWFLSPSVPFKVKSFVWLVAHKKVNTNDLLQLRRPYKALSPDISKYWNMIVQDWVTIFPLLLICMRVDYWQARYFLPSNFNVGHLKTSSKWASVDDTKGFCENAGEIGRMYEANVDDVGYRLVAIYTPIREDGVEGQPVSASTDPIAVGKF